MPARSRRATFEPLLTPHPMTDGGLYDARPQQGQASRRAARVCARSHLLPPTSLPPTSLPCGAREVMSTCRVPAGGQRLTPPRPQSGAPLPRTSCCSRHHPAAPGRAAFARVCAKLTRERGERRRWQSCIAAFAASASPASRARHRRARHRRASRHAKGGAGEQIKGAWNASRHATVDDKWTPPRPQQGQASRRAARVCARSHLLPPTSLPCGAREVMSTCRVPAGGQRLTPPRPQPAGNGG